MAPASRLESALGAAAGAAVGVAAAGAVGAAGVVPGTGGDRSWSRRAVVAAAVEIAAIAQEVRQSAVEWGAGPGHSG